MNIVQAIADPNLFARFFRDVATWSAWLTWLRALFALPMSAADLGLFCECTGRTTAFARAPSEAWLICGRRSGKSFVAALVATFLACFRSYREFLAPGERGVVVVLAVDRDQAGVIFKYVSAFFAEVPLLAGMVERETADSIELTNGVSIEVRTSSFRSVRGRTIVAALCDEIAFWRSDDSASPDREVLAALRPGMATIHPHGLLLCLSSPHAKRGALADAYSRHHGNDASDVLVWKAPTRVMNPTIAAELVERELAADPELARAEWLAEFRSDTSQAFADEDIEAAVVPGRKELPYAPVVPYSAFVDSSGGRHDAMVLAIAHRDTERKRVLDRLVIVAPPFSPETVVQSFADVVRSFGLRSVTGDRYGAEWVAEAFKRYGIRYDAAELDKSGIYCEIAPEFAQRRVQLLDVPRLTTELRLLERRPRAGGRGDSVDHPPRGSDDAANAACGALWMTGKRALPRGPQSSGRPKYAVM